MKFKILFLYLLGIFTIQAQTTKKNTDTNGIFATISTNKGDIVVELEYQKTPITVANFISLAEGKNQYVTVKDLKGKPFFDGLKFHRVIENFMIQGGDPIGNGSGDPGYSFKDEIVDSLIFDNGGILAMANSGPATNGSQFFITHKDTPWLNGKHTIFGHVTEGMDVVNKILKDDIITKISITRKGRSAKKFNASKVFSTYYDNKVEEAKKDSIIAIEKKKQEEALALQKENEYKLKYAPVITAKAAYFKETKATAITTPSGLIYKIIKKGSGIKPADGSTFYFHYAGYFEDGSLFDSSFEEVAKEYGKYDENRAAQRGYQAFPFQAGRKEGMIPGFLEGLSLMSIGDKAVFFIPSELAYGQRGAGGVIPPNTPLIFEIEMYENQPAPKS